MIRRTYLDLFKGVGNEKDRKIEREMREKERERHTDREKM